jgi:hypothetical protein
VCTNPGATALTRMPCGASSSAATSVSIDNPALAEYELRHLLVSWLVRAIRHQGEHDMSIKPSSVRGGIYVRISKDKTGLRAGVDRQRADCLALAERLGWPVARIYVDNDISAYSGKRRPDYEALCDDVKNGIVNAVIAWHPDRLHRRSAELESWLDLCGDDVAHATVQAGLWDLSTPSGRMTARILGAVAQHESEHKSERVRAAKATDAVGAQYEVAYAGSGVYPSAHAANASSCRRLRRSVAGDGRSDPARLTVSGYLSWIASARDDVRCGLAAGRQWARGARIMQCRDCGGVGCDRGAAGAQARTQG